MDIVCVSYACISLSLSFQANAIQAEVKRELAGIIKRYEQAGGSGGNGAAATPVAVVKLKVCVCGTVHMAKLDTTSHHQACAQHGFDT